MSDKAEMLLGLAERSLAHRRVGIYPTISLNVMGVH